MSGMKDEGTPESFGGWWQDWQPSSLVQGRRRGSQRNGRQQCDRCDDTGGWALFFCHGSVVDNNCEG